MIITKIKCRLRGLLTRLLKIFNLDLLNVAHSIIGVGNFGDAKTSGEKYLIETILKQYFSPEKKLVFFDIGANVGEYSQLLRMNFKKANIFSFEPNPRAYEVLNNISEKERIVAENIGMGEKIESKKILYSYPKLSRTQLGTANRDILNNYNIEEEIEQIYFFQDTIDSYCLAKKINEIDFLKIDVEGFELFVLKGSRQLIKKNKIKIIQFEFNEPNVANRVFLKDFYNILNNYDFFRLKKGELIPLGKYSTRNEIFRYQNILAINKNLSKN